MVSHAAERKRAAGMVRCLLCVTLFAAGVILVTSPSTYSDARATVTEPGVAVPIGRLTGDTLKAATAKDTRQLVENASISEEAEPSPVCRLGKRIPLQWHATDLAPAARIYLDKHVLFSITTGYFDEYFRVDVDFCTWLAHVPERNLFIVTDVVDKQDGRPGRWVGEEVPFGFDYAVFKERLAKKSTSLGWVRAQFRFYKGFDVMTVEAKQRPDIRWVIVADDDTFVNLNALVSVLHEHDLLNVFDAVETYCNSTDGSDASRWQQHCVEDLVDPQDTQALQECVSLPDNLNAILAETQTFLPPSDVQRSLLPLLAKAGSQSGLLQGCTNLERARELYERSLRLLDPLWVRERLMRREYVSRQPFGGTGHYMNRAAVVAFAKAFRWQCVYKLMMVRAAASDGALWRCLPTMGIQNARESRMCKDYGASMKSTTAQGRTELEYMRRGETVSFHIKNVMNDTPGMAFYRVALYYRALFQLDRAAYEALVGLVPATKLLRYLQDNVRTVSTQQSLQIPLDTPQNGLEKKN